MASLTRQQREVACDVCGISRHSYGTKIEFTAGLVQLRHSDGINYFWDIGDHLFLQESKNQREDNFSNFETDGKDNTKPPETVSIEELLFQDGESKQKFCSLYRGLSQMYLSGKITSRPLQTWQEEGKTISLFEKKDSNKPDLRWTHPGVCKNCGCIEEHKRLWTRPNKSLVQYLRGEYERHHWCIGSQAIIKEGNYGNTIGPEEVAINYVRQHTTIPVPKWVHSWHEGTRALVLMERLPGVTYEDALADKYSKNPTFSEEDDKTIAREVAGYVSQLRALHSPQAKSADGQLLRNFPFWRHGIESHWPLLPTHEEAKEDWYQKSLSGVDETDLAELNRLKEIFPPSEPYTFTHGDLSWPNILIHEKHVSGIIDWEMSGFAPAWWESIMLSFHAPEMPKMPNENLFLRAWGEIFVPSWKRSLSYYRDFGGDHSPSSWEALFSRMIPEVRETVKKTKGDPIRPCLPPYPPKIKDMYPPRHYMDMEGKWHPRELLPPMICLPEFSADMWHTQ